MLILKSCGRALLWSSHAGDPDYVYIKHFKNDREAKILKV